MAQAIAGALKEYKIVMLRGHGCFSTGQTLEEAFQWVTVLEESSQIILKTKISNEPFIEYRKMSEFYTKW